jgi:hypothetical protein
MGRPAKATQAKKPALAGRRPGHPPATITKPLAKSRKVLAAPERATAASPAVPKVSKDELRAQVEKLERANAVLRSKSRETNRAAKTATARIAELEDQVAQLDKQATPKPVLAKRGSKATGSKRSEPQAREIDPGDAVPPGVAVQEPAIMDDEAETARENLEEHLRAE